MHAPDTGDGQYRNPVMPSGHWGEPRVVRVGDTFYAACPSGETCPLIQILHSEDLVNWDVTGSVSRHWPGDRPAVGQHGAAVGVFDDGLRIYAHVGDDAFCVWQAEQPGGPYHLIEHRLNGMARQHHPAVFTDDDGTAWMLGRRWIQPLSHDGTAFTGPRKRVLGGGLSRPWMIRKWPYYYWFATENGPDAWGNQIDKTKIAVWRSRRPDGPFERCPHDLVRGNERWQLPLMGSVVRGPDENWWLIYSTVQPGRWTLGRQMHLDPIAWDDHWPMVHRNLGPGDGGEKPQQRRSPTFVPYVSDEFDSPELEGVTSGVIGRKWLFKAEHPEAWTLRANPGWLRLRTLYPGLDRHDAANVLVQRPVSAYYEVETRLRFEPKRPQQHAGLLLRELGTQAGVAIGLELTQRLDLKFWQHPGVEDRGGGFGPGLAGRSGLVELDRLPFHDREGRAKSEVQLKLVVEGFSVTAYFREAEIPWTPLGPTCFLTWKPGHRTAFMPGLFAGQSLPEPETGFADFDYLHHRDFESARAAIALEPPRQLSSLAGRASEDQLER